MEQPINDYLKIGKSLSLPNEGCSRKFGIGKLVGGVGCVEFNLANSLW